MTIVRGTSLSSYPQLVTELGGDPDELLRAVGIRMRDVGNYDVSIPFRSALRAIESAATATATPDFGRRLADRQGIEIVGPVGAAACTAGTVANALTIFSTYMSAYSPAVGISVATLGDPARPFIKFEILLDRVPPCPQSIELTLGVSLRVLRFLLGSGYVPLSAHLPHSPLMPVSEYVEYFGCAVHFVERTTGLMISAADLDRPLHRDDVAHRALVDYLNSFTVGGPGLTPSIRSVVRQLLPTGATTLEVIAEQFDLHTKTLQRRLADEGTTFAALVDQVRKEVAGRYLRDDTISLAHVTREIGYAEQSVLTRSCRRWFGCSPTDYRKQLRASDADTEPTEG
ncbi:AraC family transcriptional regulator [Mycolicibacter sp. MYC123]|uniref:AraC family transcriptional regulator n=1 Tax=[Mycobacterium] zoologicum TaxID=2872311 RepID=A0ABU5YEX6_9MYCO|nr:AraC family transcriptional regulator [Mycolicibacter sp. MYC123]MEB3048603.1 AraC family transcriptional regulator [Mycolicibacter sp. MYC123]